MAERAIWIGKDQQLSIRNIDQSYEPFESEVLVEVEYSGINPADIIHGRMGYDDCVAGYDFAGTVVKVGSARNEDFGPGDQVLGFSAPLLNKGAQYGVHQRFHCARHWVYRVPPSMPMADASCLMVITHTAADGIFNQLALPFENSDRPILIWGASAAVGSAAVQFAKKAGCFPIIATASERNNEAVLGLGATECFDYRDPDVVGKIKDALKKYSTKPLQHVLDAVVSCGQPSSTVLCEAIADKGALFTSSVPVQETTKQNWQHMFACRNVQADFKRPDGTVIENPPNLEWQDNMDRATRWAIDNYGHGYRMPNVVIVSGGEEGIKAMVHVANGGASMQKYVIRHPI